jgi:glycosyltransferase involved in cell wall biosynthesis
MNDTTEPVVSVLTPSYNQRPFLADCLRSVREQTYPRVEHIVMDGGSMDGTVDLLQQAGDSVIWESRQDKGQSEALNRALERSTGEIVGWVNSDDAYYRPDVIKKVVGVFAKHPETDVVYGHAALVNDNGLILHLIWVPPFSARLLRLQTFIIQPAAFVRRSAIERSFIDETYQYAMDRELWLRLSATHGFRRVPWILAIDRHHLGRKGMTMQGVAESEGRRLRQEYGIRMDRGGVFKPYKVLVRYLGLGLIWSAVKPPFAFAAQSDGFAHVALRQIAIPRSRMPVTR